MLEKDALSRITVEQMLLHPFVTNEIKKNQSLSDLKACEDISRGPSLKANGTLESDLKEAASTFRKIFLQEVVSLKIKKRGVEED
jgi:hypothetical protein